MDDGPGSGVGAPPAEEPMDSYEPVTSINSQYYINVCSQPMHM